MFVTKYMDLDLLYCPQLFKKLINVIQKFITVLAKTIKRPHPNQLHSS
jgi:hypothetical protein